MDALNRQGTLCRALFAQGKWPVMLALVAVSCAAWLASIGDAGLRFLHELFAAFAVGCTLGLAAQRLPALAVWAGQLGIPGHRQRLRSAQWLLLAMSLFFSIGLELQFAKDLRAVVVPLIAATTIASLNSLPMLSVAVAIAVLITNSLDQELLLQLFEPVGASFSLVICLAALHRWFMHVRQIHDRAAVASHSLADATHEKAHAVELEAAHVSQISYLGAALEPDPAGHLSARRLWLGMGYDSMTSWKVPGYSLLLALALLTAVHFLFAGRFDWLAYLIFSAITVFVPFGRLNGMHEAWLRTPHEQSVLLLAPRWPQGKSLKVAFLRSLLSGCGSYAAFWVLLSAFALASGWIDLRTVLITGAALLILAKVLYITMMHYLSQRRASRASPYALGYVILQLLGAMALAVGWAGGSALAALIGLAAMLLPTAPVVYLFITRRLQFPVQPPPGPPA